MAASEASPLRSTPEDAYLALGSNLGDRFSYLRQAITLLDGTPGVEVTEVSPIYETEPHSPDGESGHPAYLNAAARCRVLLSPLDLLQVCLRVEQRLGRRRLKRWDPRTIDIDIILYGTCRIEAEGLTIPHPRLAERRFVLKPLSDLAGSLRVPAPFDATVYSLLQRTTDVGEVRRHSGTLEVPRRDSGADGPD